MLTDFDQLIDRQGTNSLKWTRYAKDVLPLWVADMDFQAPRPVREALRAAVEHGVFGYELPTRKLAETVAERMRRLYGWLVGPEMVVATPGIVAGFKAAARAVCAPGEGTLVQTPVYHPFLELPEHTRVVGQNAPLSEHRDVTTLRYGVDFEALEAALHSDGARTKMFLMCHPHNPTGQIYRRAELAQFGEIATKHGIVVCSDEIHSELLLGGAEHTPFAVACPEAADQSITLVSASKTFNVVGLFCGFAIIPNSKLRARYKQVLASLGLHVNSLGLIASQVAMSGQCDEWLGQLRKYLTANRDLVRHAVRGELPGVFTTVPDATYLMWMDFTEIARAKSWSMPAQELLLERARVALNPGAEFCPACTNYVRMNLGCPRARLEEALHRIQAAVA